MKWTDKYRPKTFDDIIGNGKEKKLILDWLSKWKNGESQPCLLLIGPAGIGKTSFAQVIAQEYGDYVELNASDKRSYDVLIKTIGESAKTHSLFSNDNKLIIIDEVDGIHGNDDRGGTRAINKIIENSHHPIIMMANDFYSKKLTTIKKKCLVIKMKKVHTNSINALLKRICNKEGIKANPAAIKEIAKKSNGDMRAALNALESVADREKVLEPEDLKNLNLKDETSTIFDGVRTVLKSKNIKHIKDSLMIDEDPTMVMEYIAENIPREYESRKEIKDAYEQIALADLYFGKARQTRNYTYWRYASDFMGLGVALSKKETYKKFTKLTGPMAFSMMGRSRGKKALRESIADKMEAKMHISHEVAYSIFPYFEVMFEDPVTAYEISSFLGFDDDEIKRFRKRKIPKKVIESVNKERALERKNPKIEDNDFVNFVSSDDLEGELDSSTDFTLDGDLVKSSGVSEVVDEDLVKSSGISDDLDEITTSSSNSLDDKPSNTSSKTKSEENKRPKGQTTLFNF